MKKLLYTFAIVALLSACTADMEEGKVLVDSGTVNEKILNGSNGCVEGAMIVRFDGSAESRLAECATRSGATRTGVSGVDALLDKVGGYAVEPIFVVTEKNREKVYKAGLHLWYELRFDAESDVDAVAMQLAEVAEVEAVQFVHRVSRIESPEVVKCGGVIAKQTTRATTANKIPFNDEHKSLQWNLLNKGELSDVEVLVGNQGVKAPIEEADINVVPAWNLCKGDPTIVVAVLDEGVMHTHDDLVGNIWVNKAELNGKKGIDDDGNGYADDVYGYNFVANSGTITWDKSGDTGHGSHVAGIISATNNNGIGISSIAGGSGEGDGVRIISAQIMSGNSQATTSNIARAMQYATDCGAHIMQNSWGYTSAEAVGGNLGPGSDAAYKLSNGVEAEAIDYFIANGGTEDGPIAGGLAIFAAGNSNAPRPGYPAAYEPCVAVAAFSPSLRPAYYTDYGPGIDVVAPGGESTYYNGGIVSTVPHNGDASYAWMQGTSMACPHVSGVAALGLSYAKKLGKRYTAKEFRSLLLSSTNDIEPYLEGTMSYVNEKGEEHLINYENYKGKLGAGYIDAYKLLLQIDGTPCQVVKTGEEYQVDLSLYFGTGIANAQFVSAEASEEDIEAVGLTIGEYAGGKIAITTSKTGVATISVTMLVGGGSLEDSSKPYPTAVTRKFVVISKKKVASNGGWL